MKLMSDTISNIAGALVIAQGQMSNAVKDSKNPFFKSKYADINSVREACLPALNAQGISVWQPTVFVEGKKFVQTIFLHTSGEFVSGLTEIVYAKEGDPQAQIAGTTYARRGGLQALANLGVEDDDGNTAAGRDAAPIRPAAAPAQSAAPAANTTAPAAEKAKSFRKTAPAKEDI